MKIMKTKPFVMLTASAMLLFANFGLTAVETSSNKRSLKDSFLKRQVCLRGGLNWFSVNGTENDYLAGSNDFPVTPAYQAPAFGFGCAFFFSRSLAVGLDFDYALSTSVALRDPADGETIKADTPAGLVVAINLFQYFDLSREMRWFICLGVGGEYRMAKDREYMTDLGSRILISAPEKQISPLVAAGLGGQYMFFPGMGITLECRAAYVFRDSAQLFISPRMAVVLKF